MKRYDLLFLIPFFLTLLSFAAFGQGFAMKHESCFSKIKLDFQDLDKESKEEMIETLIKEIKEKNFTLSEDESSKERTDDKVIPDELYFHIKLSKSGFLYKKCTVETKLKEAKNYRASEKDKVLYKGSSTRQFPRVTFSGDERCVRAIRDTFIHIPTCQKE